MYNFNLSAITLKLSACGEIQTKDKGRSLKQFFFYISCYRHVLLYFLKIKMSAE